jgi:large subunit ribosomal protein L30
MLTPLLNNVVSLWKKCSPVNNSTMATIKVKQIKSRIGAPIDQKRTLDALGLRKLNAVVEKEDTPQILGMINKVKHLVVVVK